MSQLSYWQDKIKEKKKLTSFNNYLKEIVSLWPVNLHKVDSKISRFPNKERINGIIKNEDFFSNTENIDGVEYDFNKDFFSNYSVLNSKISFPNVVHISSENCDYSDIVGRSKNAYLSFIVMESENVLYSYNVKDGSKNVLNSTVISKGSENIFSSNSINKSFNIFYSKYIENSSDIWFSSNLIGCSECLFCNNLVNKSYCINNIELTKEEFISQKQIILNQKEKFEEWFSELNRIGNNIGSVNINGNSIINSTDIVNGCFVNQVENGRNLIMVGGNGLFKNCYDVFDSGTGGDSYDLYGLSGGGMGNNQYNCITSLGSNLYYCNFCWECSFCFGCIGLQNKSYCILNTQYSKEEWYEIVDKIFSQMESDGILGDFFPSELNPFYFNDTLAYIINDKFTKEEVVSDGFLWRDEEIKVDIPEGVEVIKISDLDIANYDEDILSKVIVDERGNYYRIVKMEYDFLKKHNLPLSKKHWLERIKDGFTFN